MKLWITPGYCWRTQGSRIRKIPAFETSRYDLLREEGRRGTIVSVRASDPERVELELAIEEVEVRRKREVAIGVRSIFVASAVDPEIVVLLETFGVRQDHDAGAEGAESELTGLELLACAEDGAATGATAGLGRGG